MIGELMSRGPRYFCSNPGGPNWLKSAESCQPRAPVPHRAGWQAGAEPKIALIVSITEL